MLYGASFIRSAPFVRFIIPFIAGILLQYSFQFTVNSCFLSFLLGILLLLLVPALSSYHRFRYKIITGLIVAFVFIAFGILITAMHDVRLKKDWLGNSYTPGDSILLKLDEPLSEKQNSFKSRAAVVTLLRNGEVQETSGSVILYFRKDSTLLSLGYGSQLFIRKELQTIRNSGNPGAFDYRRYCQFQGISHQVYLEPADFIIVSAKKKNDLRSFIYKFRIRILNVLSQYIHGPKELGLAEALLIGYKDDLDKDLTRSYSNTGVVHVIAISGLHLGLFYWLLVQLLKPLRKSKSWRWICPVIIITILWIFSCLAGAQPSVLRSAMMFTCIVIGENLTRQTNIYNTLAFSAFVLLCYNPFWLWDVGFQLSYAAVLSIIVFMQPFYNTLFIKNKMLDFLWKLNSVTLSAQILTLPVMLFHFHQFPLFFLLTNLIAVPLSSIILLGEILLCLLFFLPVIANGLGQVISGMIWLMNNYIERVDSLPIAVWDFISINLPQSILLLAIACFMGIGLIEIQKRAFVVALICLFSLMILRTNSFMRHGKQQKLIVYNIPKVMAVDLISGTRFLHINDSVFSSKDDIYQFHIRPSRIMNRCYYELNDKKMTDRPVRVSFGKKNILIIRSSIAHIPADITIVAGNALPDQLGLSRFPSSLVIISTSARQRNTKEWKEACIKLNIPYHDVKEKGAFVMSIRDTTFAALLSKR